MGLVADYIWCVPLPPLAAAAAIALMPRRAHRAAVAVALVGMALAWVLSMLAMGATLGGSGAGTGVVRRVMRFDWFELGTTSVPIGFVLDPLGAIMLGMVSLVGLLIFVFSAGYMAHDDNVTRFFGFMSLFAAAMLGLVIANSLLLLFACWEVMGLASYLLIGFWFQKPSAAAAAKKAFLVTRVGDLGLFLGMLWLYDAAGTLLFYDGGAGCLEAGALGRLSAGTASGSMTVGAGISLLLLLGAIGKSGQVPLHVWLPDAMEGPTPVSALIHAATMVAAGVFLVARVFPLMAGGAEVSGVDGTSLALRVVTWVGAVTAVFAALVAVAQNDIKRVLAYSTVSQLGYMFLGLGTGGVAVGMFHLITHAFFKALLFLGAGSVIHGCHEEQDIRRMGGLRRRMPWTFATYAVGMMALSGVPLFFSGFWSKDEILHGAWGWPGGRWPFYLGLGGAFLTAFYMTRQMAEVFFGRYRGGNGGGGQATTEVHESPRVMTLPLGVLAVFAMGLGWVGTPAWPWFHGYLEGRVAVLDVGKLAGGLPLMLVAVGAVGAGLGLGWVVYGRRPRVEAGAPDALAVALPKVHRALSCRLWFDELYEATVVRWHRGLAVIAGWVDVLVIGGLVGLAGLVFRLLAQLARLVDEVFVNAGFDAGCGSVRWWGWLLSRLQGGRLQRYLGGLALGMVVMVLLLFWGWGGGWE